MFTMTPEQEYIMSILKVTKVMNRLQVRRLLSKLNPSTNAEYATRCIEQLRFIRKIAWKSEDIFTLPFLQKSDTDKEMLSAIDIMLDLTDVRVQAISASAHPYKLCFLAEQQSGYGNYAVIIVPPGKEMLITASLTNSRLEERTVIFLLSDASQAESVKTVLPHFFAIRDGGRHRYLKGGG